MADPVPCAAPETVDEAVVGLTEVLPVGITVEEATELAELAADEADDATLLEAALETLEALVVRVVDEAVELEGGAVELLALEFGAGVELAALELLELLGVTLPPAAGVAVGTSGCLPESGVVLNPPQDVAALVRVVPYMVQMLTLSGPAQTRQLA